MTTVQTVTKSQQPKRIVCEHGRQKRECKECGGSGICERGRRKAYCKECGGSGFCEYGRRKAYCKECGGSGKKRKIAVAQLTDYAISINRYPVPIQPVTKQSHIPLVHKRSASKVVVASLLKKQFFCVCPQN